MLGVAPNVPGFLKVTHVVERSHPVFDALYPYAWFVGFAIAAAAYYALEARGRARVA